MFAGREVLGRLPLLHTCCSTSALRCSRGNIFFCFLSWDASCFQWCRQKRKKHLKLHSIFCPARRRSESVWLHQLPSGLTLLFHWIHLGLIKHIHRVKEPTENIWKGGRGGGGNLEVNGPTICPSKLTVSYSVVQNKSNVSKKNSKVQLLLYSNEWCESHKL